MSREYAIKQLTRQQKLALMSVIMGNKSAAGDGNNGGGR